MDTNYSSWVPQVLDLAKLAANAILDIYKTNSFNIKNKPDHSPVTEADLIAHAIIREGLTKLSPSLPILSEEDEMVPFEVRQKWRLFWLVDPLDGTKEFIQKSPDFTVNIALIADHLPVLGVVVAPALEHYFWASEAGAFYQEKNEPIQHLKLSQKIHFPIRIALSRNHTEEKRKWKSLMENFKNVEFVYRGSALKICLVAKGEVDLYPRLGPTGEWDTAAGQCILEKAGGRLVDLSGRTFKYNARDTLVNNGFLAAASSELLSYIVDKSE